MKEKVHISDLFNHGLKGHNYYDFIDIPINQDTKLFIDPLLIEIGEDLWCQKIHSIIKSFNRELIKAYRKGSQDRKRELLTHAREQNGTRLGYGCGNNGKGNSAEGLLEIFSPLEEILNSIHTVEELTDLTILLPGFAEDGLSDLITNVIHEQLNIFTSEQLRIYEVENNVMKVFWTWDCEALIWKRVERPAYIINNQEVLFVPKNIVRPRYLFSVNQYFSRIVLENARNDYLKYDGTLMSKAEIIRNKRSTSPHWQYEEALLYTKRNNSLLTEYHEKLPDFYRDNGGSMKDEALDKYIY